MKILDVLNSPWAIVPEKLREITEVYARHLRGDKIDIESIRSEFGRAEPAPALKPYDIVQRVAVLSVEGVLGKKMNMFMHFSGGTSTQLLGRALAQALDDPAVNAIVLSVDSPGGTVDGTQELARLLMQARSGDKPIVSWVDGYMASAAYWIGAAADAIYIGADTDVVGSIGVVTQHVDYSGAEAKAGIKTTEIYAGKFKRIASDVAPLSDAGREYLQERVDYLYSVFVEHIARQRDVSVDAVLNNMADGKIFIGRQAITAGLVDGAATLPDLIAELAAGTYARRRPMDGASAAVIMLPAVLAAKPDASGAGAVFDRDRPSIPLEKDIIMDRATLEKDHPAIAQAIRDEGAAAGRAEGLTAGAETERARIRAVEAQALPGHEVLIGRLKFDGVTTGPEAAVQVLAAERTANRTMAAALAADAPQPAPHAIAPPLAQAAADEPQSNDPDVIAARCKATWESSSQVRAEFLDLQTYTAFEKAQARGQVRILGGKRAA